MAKTWQELLFGMADMDSARYEALKGVDIFEFYTLFDAWKARIDAKKEALEKQIQQSKSKSR